MKVNIL